MAIQIIPRSIRRAVNTVTNGWYANYMQKKMPMMWPEWVNGNPQWRMVDARAYIEEGFNMNSLIYAAVTWKAKNMTQAVMRAYSGDRKNPELLPVKHPLTMLMARPNEYQSQRMFMTLNEVFLNMTGNAFIMMDREAPGKLPIALYPLNPDRVRIIPLDGRKVGYLFVPDGLADKSGVPIVAEDMIHIKLPNPMDRLEGQGYGLSPVSSLARSADADNRVTQYMYSLFKRGLMMGGILSFKTPVSDTVMARTRKRWQEQYGGSDKWAENVGVLDNGAEYQRIAPTFDELGFGPIDERNETRILMPFGVPPIVVGSRIGLMRSTYANYEQARKAAWEDTLMYEIGLFGDDFEYHLSPEDDTFVMADLSDVHAMKMNHKETAMSAKAYWDMGVPARIAFDTVGARIEEYDGMETSYVPTSVVDANKPPPDPLANPLLNPLGTVNDLTKPPKKPGANDGTVAAGDVEGADAENELNGQKPGKKKAVTPTPTMQRRGR